VTRLQGDLDTAQKAKTAMEKDVQQKQAQLDEVKGTASKVSADRSGLEKELSEQKKMVLDLQEQVRKASRDGQVAKDEEHRAALQAKEELEQTVASLEDIKAQLEGAREKRSEMQTEVGALRATNVELEKKSAGSAEQVC
jgi:phage shock protein A